MLNWCFVFILLEINSTYSTYY